MKFPTQTKLEPGTEMACVRELRDLAMSIRSVHGKTSIGTQMNTDLMLELCHLYASQSYGGLNQELAYQYVREVVASSTPMYINDIYKNKDISHAMRFILVDWLVEVAGMKDFSGHTLHSAICMVDRYLKVHVITRSKLQLLGVAAMVLCSRFLGHDIITIREAAWLTDNTYKYEDVVRMMGEITATLKGSMKVTTVLDFLLLFIRATTVTHRTQCLAEYLCELSLLQSDLGDYSQAQLAASCLLLARIQSHYDSSTINAPPLQLSGVWDTHMELFTGFPQKQIALSTLHIYEKCFDELSMVDHREVVLQAVKTRYADEKFDNISAIKMLASDTLQAVLGIDTVPFFNNTLMPPTDDGLIMSPSRSKNRKQLLLENSMTLREVLSAREQAATPSPQQATTDYSTDQGFVDLELLWCNDNVTFDKSSTTTNKCCNVDVSSSDSRIPGPGKSFNQDPMKSSQPIKRHRSGAQCSPSSKNAECTDSNNNSDVNNNGDHICSSTSYSTPVSSCNSIVSTSCLSPADSGIDITLFSENEFLNLTSSTSGLPAQKRHQLSRSRSFTLSPRITPTSPGSSTTISLSPCIGSPSSIILSPLTSPLLRHSPASTSSPNGYPSSRRRCVLQPDVNRATLSPNICIKRLNRSIQTDREHFNALHGK